SPALTVTKIGREMYLKRVRQRLEQLDGRALVAAAKCNGDGEFAAAWKIYFASQRDVALLGGAEFPIHFEIVHHVLPAIAEADIANRSARETRAACDDQVNVFALRVHDFDSADFRTPRGVACTTPGYMRCQQRIEPQLAAQRFV